MNKPIIGITTNLLYRSGPYSGRYSTNNNKDYEDAIFKAGGIPILLPPTADLQAAQSQLHLCQGLLLAGGDDINPLLYGEQPSKGLGETHLLVDIHHLNLAKLAIRRTMPILAICRGMQALNIAQGGNVYQDIIEYSSSVFQHHQNASRYDVCHTVTTTQNSLLNTLLGDSFPTNSFHHQALHKLGENILVTAQTDDHIIEGIELEGYPFAVGVQWHPETMLSVSDSMLPLFKKFIETCL